MGARGEEGEGRKQVSSPVRRGEEEFKGKEGFIREESGVVEMEGRDGVRC